MIYGYIRVSTKAQKIDRQYEEIKAFGVDDKYIYVDKESGKDFDRTNYKRLIKKIKRDDLLIVKSIDRLGRNYHMILDEWSYITKTKEADIKVLDMPLLDTRIEGKNLVGKFISDIVLQVLSFVAENERNNIKERQAEGIPIHRLDLRYSSQPPRQHKQADLGQGEELHRRRKLCAQAGHVEFRGGQGHRRGNRGLSQRLPRDEGQPCRASSRRHDA